MLEKNSELDEEFNYNNLIYFKFFLLFYFNQLNVQYINYWRNFDTFNNKNKKKKKKWLCLSINNKLMNCSFQMKLRPIIKMTITWSINLLSQLMAYPILGLNPNHKYFLIF